MCRKHTFALNAITKSKLSFSSQKVASICIHLAAIIACLCLSVPGHIRHIAAIFLYIRSLPICGQIKSNLWSKCSAGKNMAEFMSCVLKLECFMIVFLSLPISYPVQDCFNVSLTFLLVTD